MTNTAYYDSLLTVGGLYLIYKQRIADFYFSLQVGVVAFAETYDKINQDNGVCDGTLLCTRVNARHKKGCLAKW